MDCGLKDSIISMIISLMFIIVLWLYKRWFLFLENTNWSIRGRGAWCPQLTLKWFRKKFTYRQKRVKQMWQKDEHTHTTVHKIGNQQAHTV